MTTLGNLKAEIALEIARSDLTQAIANTIAGAIRHYRRTRFYFNVLDSIDIACVIGQGTYGKDDLPAIANISRIDNVFLVKTDRTSDLRRLQAAEIELSRAPSGTPTGYAYINQQLRIDPAPDAEDTIRIYGQVWVDGPAGDSESDNPWMLEAYDLIKYRAKSSLYAEYMEDLQLAQAMTAAEQEQLQTLVGETNMRAMTGFIEPTEF